MQPMTVGPLLRQLRHEAGRSQSEQASVLSEFAGRAVTRNEVSRWESEARLLTPYWQEHVARSFDVPVGKLARAVASAKAKRRGSRHPDLEPDGSDVERRAFIGAVAGLAASLPSLGMEVGRRLGAEDARNLLSRTARLRRLDDFLGGSDTYRLYASEVAATTRLLNECSMADPVRRTCAAVVAEQAQLAGWAAFDAGMQSEAKRHYTTSFEAASEAKDTTLAGNALAFLAYQEVSARRPDTEMAAASFTTAQAVATPRVKALLLERMAWTNAVAGRANETDRALKLAEEALLLEADRPEPDWVFWVDADEIQIMTGRCWAELKRPLRAVPTLEAVLGRYSDTHARDKSMYLTWLARSYIDAGEVERGAQVLMQSISLASGVGSVRPAECIRGVLRRLQTHRRLPEVAAVFDAASGLN